MMLKFINYSNGYHIASFAKNEVIFNKMRTDGYSCFTVQNYKLIFFPEGWAVDLLEEENQALKEVEDYSIFEFNNGSAYVYYNAASVDNALFITNKCNSNCIMCPTSDIVRKNSGIEDINNLLKICSQMPSDASHITITGGEPFLIKKDIFILFKYLKDNLNEIDYLLLTNGRALSDREYASIFKETIPSKLIVGIPLHGYNPDTHDGITRAKGSFNQTMSGLKNILDSGTMIEIRIVVSRLNIGFIDKIADLIIKELKGIYIVRFIGLEMLGNARINLEEVWIDYKESFELIKESIKKLVMHGFNVGIYNYPLCCVDRSYWALCEKSITDYKIRYLEECDECSKKDACGGMFSGTFRLMKGKINAIK
jgi:His-Xaa-Ser system radical SAM maturase HxsC